MSKKTGTVDDFDILESIRFIVENDETTTDEAIENFDPVPFFL